MSSDEDDKSHIAYHNPGWIAQYGGWIHANNVLFYFAESDFYDRMSRNQELIDQNAGVPEREFEFLATRQKFEKALLDRPGLQYVVEVDPLENKVLVGGPNGQEPSDLWVIRKQLLRTKGDPKAIQVLDYFYICNNTIYQAPRMNAVFNYRMLQSLLSIDKIVKTAAELPVFSASNGHTYFRPGQKATTALLGESQQSKMGTPAPDMGIPASQELSSSTHAGESQSDERTLREALTLTMNHGGTFYDDAPLVGEPGNLRFSVTRNPVQNLKDSVSRSALPSKASTPVPGQPIKAASIPISPESVKIGETVGELRTKPKRKKSMATNEVSNPHKNGIASSPASPIRKKP